MNSLINNWVKFLAQAMKANGCPSEIKTEEDVLDNMYYLSKEDGRGSRYIPLQYKRMIEKIVCGLFNSTLEYNDKEDVYFEKIGNTVVCTANVRFVTYNEDGTSKVLGRGFHQLTLDEVLPGVFLSDAERVSKWKAMTLGGAKSRALYDAGIGLEFYGDIFMPEINLDENEITPEETKETSEKKRKVNPEATYTESGMPIPQPKKGRPKKEAATTEAPVETPTTSVEDKKSSALESTMDINIAKAIKADVGNYAGMTLGQIYETAPKNLIFLARNSSSEEVVNAAKVIITSDPELSLRFEAA